MFLATLKLLQPFFELSKPPGTSFEGALGVYYLSSSFRPDTLQALFKGHFVLLWTSTVVLAVGLIVPLSSEALSVDTDWGCSGGSSLHNPCPPRIVVDKTVVRVIEGLLIFVGVMIINLWHMLRRVKSGVHADPSSLATMASLLHHPDVLADFQRISPNATNSEIFQQLKGNWYKLGDYRSARGETRYGLVKLPNMEEQSSGTAHALTPNKTLHKSMSDKEYQSKILIFTVPSDILFGIVLLGLLGVVVAYRADTSDTGFNRFMSSRSFGPRFIMTLTGALIGARWKQVEREIRVLAAYRRLAASPATAADSILINGTTHPIATIPHAVYHQRWMLALVACVCGLAELLVIALAGVPYRSGQIELAYHVSTFFSIAVLGIMLITLFCVVIWRRTNPKLPRTPDTLVGVWSFLYASRMTESFADFSTLDEKERDQRIISMRNKYTLRYATRLDGTPRLTVDVIEEL